MPSTSRSIRLSIAVVVTALALTSIAAATQAQPRADAWAWAVVRSPERNTQEITGKDRASSSGKKINVKRLAKGYHRVRFGGFTTTRAHFQVTPLSGQGDICSYYGDSMLTGATAAYVNCRDRSGKPRDVKFMISMVQSWTAHNGAWLAYLWAHMPKSSSYSPHPEYYFNSLGGDTVITRLGVGEYRLKIRGDGVSSSRGGSLQVTAFDSKRHVCRVVSILGDKFDLGTLVRCRNLAGRSVDAKFNLVYHKDEGLKGAGGDSWAYLYANWPTTNWYVPTSSLRESSPAGTPSVKRKAKGRYIVKLPSMPLGGAVQVTAVDAWKRCHVSAVRKNVKPQRVEVRCFKPKGNALGDAKFMLSYEK